MAKELFSKGNERALLGLLVQNANLMSEVSGAIAADDFFLPENQNLFKAIEQTTEKHGTADLVLVVDQFSLIAGIDKEKAKEIIVEIVTESGIVSNVNSYIEVIREKRRQRDVKSTIKSTSDVIDTKDVSAIEVIGELETSLRSISDDSTISQLEDIETLTGEFETNIKDMIAKGGNTGIRTGYPKFDDKIGGFRPGQLVIIAARPSVGKTAFSLALSQAIAKKQNVGFFSLEMPSDQIILRMLTNHSRIAQYKIEKMQFNNQNEQNSFNAAINQIKGLNLWIDDSPTLNVSTLGWKARKLKKEKGLDIIFIDYLQLLEGDKALQHDRQQAVTKISKGLKALARQLEVPIIALSQLSRKVEEGKRKPIMSDIRESGSIEQDADIIAFLHREDYQKEGDSEIYANSDVSEIEVIIAKHRNGQTGSISMQFDKAHGSIKETSAKAPYKS